MVRLTDCLNCQFLLKAKHKNSFTVYKSYNNFTTPFSGFTNSSNGDAPMRVAVAPLITFHPVASLHCLTVLIHLISSTFFGFFCSRIS